ncbi:MAG: hypothetical protein WC399_02370 [Bacilli bacterium]|jgi:hypothetical protein
MVKRLQLLKDLCLAALIATIFGTMLAVIEVFIDGFTAFFFITAAIAAIGLVSTVILETRIRFYRFELKKIPREHRGHQDEPGSWQCECGRYNTEYRSVCLGCGRKKQPRTPF